MNCFTGTVPVFIISMCLIKAQPSYSGLVIFRREEDVVELYLLEPNRIEFRGGHVRGGEGGRGGTGAMRRTVHINKLRLTDVQKLLLKVQLG